MLPDNYGEEGKANNIASRSMIVIDSFVNLYPEQAVTLLSYQFN